MTAIPDPDANLSLLVHPHQLEVQEFASYALVIDARPLADFVVDHIPGAVCLPVGQQRRDGTEMPFELQGALGSLKPTDPVLVYCGRGGLDSLVWAELLRRAGLTVDVLPGGWATYLRWVAAGLEILPRSMRFLRLCGAPGSATARVLVALRSTGHQVIDLMALCDKPIAPGVPLCADARLSQGGFESRLLDAMRILDVGRAVWIDGSVPAFCDLQLPPALREALGRARVVAVDVPVAERAHAWAEDLRAAGMDGEQLISVIEEVTPAPEATVVDQWQRLLAASGVEALLATLVDTFLDRRFGVPGDPGATGSKAAALRIESLASAALMAALSAWCAHELGGSPGHSGSIRP